MASPSTPPSDYGFRALTEEDLPLAERWLLEPHVRRWWDEGEPRYPEGTLEEYRQAIHGEDPTRMFVIGIDGREAGLIQSYLIGDHLDYAAALGLDWPAVGVDVFIGEPDLVGRGHGAGLLRRFVRDIVFAQYDVDRCVIGPSTDNTAAIRAYEKAGFRHFRDALVPGEPTAEHLMLLTREEAARG